MSCRPCGELTRYLANPRHRALAASLAAGEALAADAEDDTVDD